MAKGYRTTTWFVGAPGPQTCEAHRMNDERRGPRTFQMRPSQGQQQQQQQLELRSPDELISTEKTLRKDSYLSARRQRLEREEKSSLWL
jgi:hypothetical protein